MSSWIIAQDCVYNGWITELDVNGDPVIYASEAKAEKALHDLLTSKSIDRKRSGYFTVEKEHYDEFTKSAWGR